MTKGYALARDEGRAIWFLGGLLTWKAVAENTAGAYGLVEQLGPRGFAAPVHLHEREAEGFYVLEGEVSFILEDERLQASAGSFVYVPPSARHAFVVESQHAKFLTFINPARPFEDFVEELSEPAKSRTIPSPPAGPPDVARIEAAAAKYGQKILGPPPAPRR